MAAKEDDCINILLLGQTGVGKSTFINAFENYLRFKKFEKAKKSKLHYLIPSAISIVDNNSQLQIIKCGEDANERTDCEGQSATQQCRSYKFNTNEKKFGFIDVPGKNIPVQIIDTPGFGDTRGFDQDKMNANHIVEYLKKIHLNAICILLKPNESKLTPSFEYYLREMIGLLPPDASNNIVFMYTNTRSTFFKPGDTTIPLKIIIDNIKSSHSIDIPYGMDNVFCLDNEVFRYLMLRENRIKIGEKELFKFNKSWKISAKEAKRMIKYITKTNNNSNNTSTVLQ